RVAEADVMAGIALFVDVEAWYAGEQCCDLGLCRRIGLPYLLVLGDAELHGPPHVRGEGRKVLAGPVGHHLILVRWCARINRWAAQYFSRIQFVRIPQQLA